LLAHFPSPFSIAAIETLYPRLCFQKMTPKIDKGALLWNSNLLDNLSTSNMRIKTI